MGGSPSLLQISEPLHNDSLSDEGLQAGYISAIQYGFIKGLCKKGADQKCKIRIVGSAVRVAVAVHGPDAFEVFLYNLAIGIYAEGPYFVIEFL